MPRTYLITGIGGDIAQNVARIAREVRPGARLVGTDIDLRHGGARCVDTVVALPPADDGGYLDTLREVIAREGVDVVLPLTEPELRVLAEAGALGGPPGWIAAGSRAIEVGIDKLRTMRALAEIGLPVPWTRDARTEVPAEYPCIFKPRTSSGSRLLFTVEDEATARCLARLHPSSIFQALLVPADQEITCAIFRSRNGTVAVLQLRRKLVGGLTGWAEVVSVPEVTEMCETIANELEVTGCINVQLRLTEAGPRVFEINPRISSTALMRHMMGFEDVRWALDELEGTTPRFHVPEAGRIGVKTFGAELLN
ncbi:MAG: ATP-grasp domain-containing protein [Gemmatimonadota bacterium]